jgi:pyruvate,water dikinase
VTAIVESRGVLDIPDAGGKARALAAAMGAGLPVPPWFLVRSRALPNGASEGTSYDDVDLASEVAAALRRLAPGGQPVAVRSSGADEDGAEHSFAGQFDSFLNVRHAEVLSRIAAVRASGSTGRVLSYRRSRGLAAHPQPPNVIVQRMVPARVAGVAFSADPVSGRRGIAVISAAHGLGTAVVNGDADADVWHVDRRGAIVARRIALKHGNSHEAVVSVSLAEDEARGASLTDDEIRAVTALARAAARSFGRPQDIEWAYEDDRLWLLQTRPITSLDSRPDPDGEIALWDNSNIVESYSGTTSPLTFSFASEVYEHVYRQFCRLMCVPDASIARHDDAFQNMLGFVRGRLYYNLLNWYRVLALLPGYTLNRAFMEQMMGVKEALPPDLAARIGTASPAQRSRARDAVRVLRMIGGLAAAHFTIEKRTRAFQRRLDAALAAPDPALDLMRPDELVLHYRSLRQRLLLSWDAPIVNDFFAMIFYGLLRRACVRWLDDSEGTLQNDLVAGDAGMVSAEPALRIREMARLAAADRLLVERLDKGTVGEARMAARNVPQFAAALDAYLEKFGDRTINELKLETQTLHDDPLPLLRSIGALARQPGAAYSENHPGAVLRSSARQRAAGALRRHPVRRAVFGWMLRNARARIRDRENLRLERTRLFGRVRRIFVELGKRLHAAGALDAPADVFFLRVDEVLAFVEGRTVTTNLRGLVAIRREEQAGHAALTSRSGPAPWPA